MRHIIALHCIANINVYLPPENVPSLRLSASIFRILCQKCCLEPSLDQRLCLGHALEHLVSSWLRTGAGCRERVMSGDPDTHSGSPPQPAPQVTPAGHWVPYLYLGKEGLHHLSFYCCKNLFIHIYSCYIIVKIFVLRFDSFRVIPESHGFSTLGLDKVQYLPI